jgi:hypothetical protein
MKSVSYSVPPAGNKFPGEMIFKALKGGKNDSDQKWFAPLRHFLGTEYILFLSSGRASSWLILKSLSQLRPSRREVVIPAYTCPAVASAILRAGLQPVLADMNLEDFGFSSEDLKQKITSNTLGIILVHLFGYPANLGDAYEICKQNDIFFVEDTAQAFGNAMKERPDRKLGLLGDAGFFSFGRGKPLSLMHGGVFVTNSEEIYHRASDIYQKFTPPSRIQGLGSFLTLVSYQIFSNPYLYWIPQGMPLFQLGETIFEPEFVVSKGADLVASIIDGMMAIVTKEEEIREKKFFLVFRDLSK